METDAQKVTRLAERSVEQAARRPWTITKFGRHDDGYLHAHVTPAGAKHIYVHLRYGSWMAPGTRRGQGMMKELESLMEPQLAREAKLELSRKARALERAERGANNAANDASAAPDDQSGGSVTGDDLRQEGGGTRPPGDRSDTSGSL